MATIRFIPHHISRGETIAASLKGRLDYGKAPEKTNGGELISAYECDYESADAEFLLSKAKYHAITGREQKRDADVLCYQIRQSFKPGEVDAATANAIGYDLALRWTKGAHAFFVATHIDCHHVHNHIYFNSTTLDCTRKFDDFKGSARALRRLSDRICLENNLSVISDPRPRSRGQFKHYGQWLDAQEKARAASAGPAPRKVNLIIDIQDKLRQGKGPGYERWATVYNLKQMAAALQYLQENNLLAYEDLEARADAAVDRFHDLSDKLKVTEAAMQRNAELKTAITDYAKTRPVFEEYKAKKYSNKFLAEHEADIADHRAAQAVLRELLDGAKLPRMDALKAEWQQLIADKKSGYADYRAAQKDMREIIAVKSNIDYLLGITNRGKNKEQER